MKKAASRRALETISERVHRDFEGERRVLSFDEFVELFSSDPLRHSRDASRYLRDLFDYYGRREVERPWGKQTRYQLFDLPWLEPERAKREALVGQEAIQSEIYRALSNFVREGRPNRLVLLHGPNGSAKSTVVACIMKALEHYSRSAEGALYRFHWVFPSKVALKGAIGFADARSGKAGQSESYAHLAESEVDARLLSEVRDHPIFLIPSEHRRAFLEELVGAIDLARDGAYRWMLEGELSHKNRQIFDALLTSEGGSLPGVLRHVQVERFFISRRYRCGAVTVGPQLSVDAGERQVTANRSFAALPASLQSMTLFEAFGELVDASGGVLEFADLLKRPLDAFKYLQHSVETGEVGLGAQTVKLNCVMLASCNDLQLAAFREHGEYQSFRGRLELVRSPYLASWLDEQGIYDAQVADKAHLHIAPHATQIAAMFAVLTRLRRPDPKRHQGVLASLVGKLTAMQKLDLYADGTTPEGLGAEAAKLLRASVGELYVEGASDEVYEGALGASPREMRTVLLDAAQNAQYAGLSPFAVLEELEALCQRKSDFFWLQIEPEPGGYHDPAGFLVALRERLLDMTEDDFRRCSGLVEEERHGQLFMRYVMQVSYWIKGEKLRNPLTGESEEPDLSLMQEVEALLGVEGSAEELRHGLMGRIAAWAIDHPGEAVDHPVVFAAELARMRRRFFEAHQQAVARLGRDMTLWLRGGKAAGFGEREAPMRAALASMKDLFGYTEESAATALGVLANERWADLAE